MTEAEWLACVDPNAMLELLRCKASDRKLRFFILACCRRVLHLLTDERSRNAVMVGERYIDGHATEKELNRAYQQAQAVYAREAWTEEPHVEWAAVEAACPFLLDIDTTANCAFDSEIGSEGTNLLRDIFGNPFRPVAFDPAWRTPTVASLAQAIYADRRFADLPILADALEDAGCTNSDVLEHCRTPGEHVRGCWVVDLALGKE